MMIEKKKIEREREREQQMIRVMTVNQIAKETKAICDYRAEESRVACAVEENSLP